MPVPVLVRRALPIMLMIGFGAGAVALNQRYLATKTRELEEARRQLLADYQEPIAVAVAATDIRENTVIESQHLTRSVIPGKFVQPYAATSPSEVLGLVTLAPMAEGEQILTNKLRRQEEGPRGQTLSSVMPKGKRAVTIAVDPLSGVGGFIRPGDVVDVLWLMALPGPEQGGQVVTVTLFQHIPVLAVDSESLSGSDRGGQGGSKSQYTVTLGLTPQETSTLLFAREQGKIQLSLRPRSESGTAAVPPMNPAAFMEKHLGIKPPVPQTETGTQRQAVEVYKGLKRELVEVKTGP